jgi:hypothetical protein
VGRIDSVALDGRGGHGVVHGGDAVDDCRDDVSGEDVTARPRRDGRRQGACFGQGVSPSMEEAGTVWFTAAM